MRNYWHVWYDLSYYSIRATIRHIIFSVYKVSKKRPFEGILETVWEPFDFFFVWNVAEAF
jgi:hypothetical protein